MSENHIILQPGPDGKSVFDGLAAGSIDLSAPVIGDVIQIGWSGDDAANMPKVGVHVEIEGEGGRPDIVRITRQDEQPLTFGVLSGGFGDGIASHPILSGAVQALEFRRREAGWEVVPYPETSTIGTDPVGAASRVAEAVARFVRKKQLDAQEANRLALH